MCDSHVIAQEWFLEDEYERFKGKLLAEEIMCDCVIACLLIFVECISLIMKTEYDFSEAKRGAVIPQTGKTRITIYIDEDVLEAFRERGDSAGKGYQTIMNEALREYLNKVNRL
jgi:hypothetical protein